MAAIRHLVQGHPRSLTLVVCVNRKPTCSVMLSLIVTLNVFRTVFELLAHKPRKYLVSPPTLVWRPGSGGTRQNFGMKLMLQKLEEWDYCAVKIA